MEQQVLQGAPGKVPGSKRVRQGAAGDAGSTRGTPRNKRGKQRAAGGSKEHEGEGKSSRALPGAAGCWTDMRWKCT